MTVRKIAERDGLRCAIGGEPIDLDYEWPHPRAATVDHIYPTSRGGLDQPTNVQLACWIHNRRKGNRLGYVLPSDDPWISTTYFDDSPF